MKEKRCTDARCPLPLELISRVEKAIKKVRYDKNAEKVEICYDESRISEEGIINRLKKIGYEVHV